MNNSPTVLVVDDDDDIRSLMQDFLEAAGYRVHAANDGPSALAAVRREPVDCILLDVMMPGQSGFDVVREIRGFSDVPVLFLTAKQEDVDKIRGLSLGADDYIVKSATPGEIVARVQAVLRRTLQRPSTGTSTIWNYDRFTIDLDAREVQIGEQTIDLTAREFDLLEMLARNPRRVLSRDAIFEELWGPYGDRHSLTVHIGRLREKLEIDPSRPTLITTVWGVGYRFEGQRIS